MRLLLCSDWGYITATVFEEWVCNFQEKARSVDDNQVLFLLDKHSAHVRLEAIKFCLENSIHMMKVPFSTAYNMWCSWLRHCATSRKVSVSILDYVFGIFHCHNPCGRTMALGSIQPLTEMSTRNISCG